MNIFRVNYFLRFKVWDKSLTIKLIHRNYWKVANMNVDAIVKCLQDLSFF